MKSLLPLLLFAPALFTSCSSLSSLPQAEREALVKFREGEIIKLNQFLLTLNATVGGYDASILDIDGRIEGLKEKKAETLGMKAAVEDEIKSTQELIDENQERLKDLVE